MAKVLIISLARGTAERASPNPRDLDSQLVRAEVLYYRSTAGFSALPEKHPADAHYKTKNSPTSADYRGTRKREAYLCRTYSRQLNEGSP